MNRLWISLLALFTVALVGCSSKDDCILECAGQCQGSPLHGCEADCLKKDCGIVRDISEDEDEPTAISRDALTHAATRVYSISSLYYQTGNCAHGAIATDSASRCNSPTETLFARIPTEACPPGTTPTLSVTVTEWQYNTTVDVRRVLRPMVDPPAGISSACADAYPGAKWDLTGAGQAWTTPGAKGLGTDVSTEKVSFFATSSGPTNLVKTVDLRIKDANGDPTGATLIDACAPSGECIFALFASAHIWEAPGSFMLAMTCSAPPAVCGDGQIAGSEACDDGLPPASGDGCSATCAIESGWTCSGAPSTCSTACGDGVKAGAEQCDDGNVVSHDGCSATCLTEACSWQ